MCDTHSASKLLELVRKDRRFDRRFDVILKPPPFSTTTQRSILGDHVREGVQARPEAQVQVHHGREGGDGAAEGEGVGAADGAGGEEASAS